MFDFINKKKWVNDILSSPILLSVFIVISFLLILFFVSHKHYKKKGNGKELLRIGIYTLLFTTCTLFLHENMINKKIEEDNSDKELETLVQSYSDRIPYQDEIQEYN